MARKKQIEEEVNVEVSTYSNDLFEGFEALDSAFTIMSAGSSLSGEETTTTTEEPIPALSGFDAIVGRAYTGPHGSWQEHVRKVNQGMV